MLQLLSKLRNNYAIITIDKNVLWLLGLTLYFLGNYLEYSQNLIF